LVGEQIIAPTIWFLGQNWQKIAFLAKIL